MPRWLRACRLTVPDPGQPVTVQLTPFRRSAVQPRVRPRRDQVPRVVGVRSGPSWDEVRVRLVPGQTPEEFDQAARALAVARGVARCQVRELGPRLVSIDYQRCDRLRDVVSCRDLAALAYVAGADIDLRKVWSGRTEYGTDWLQPLAGGHTPDARAQRGRGRTRSGWAPIVSIAPAIRDGLVRVSGIDPKGMELAYGRRIFHRYAVTSRDALALLDDLIDGMETRKTEFASRVRTVPVTREHPLELLEFDEIGALVRYVGDRKTREADRRPRRPPDDPGPGARLHRPWLRAGAHQGHRARCGSCSPAASACASRASPTSGWCWAIRPTTAARGPTGSASPNPGSATCSAKASANRCAIRAGWVPDETIKQLEDFVTGTRPGPAGRRAGLAAAPTSRPARLPHRTRPEVSHEHARRRPGRRAAGEGDHGGANGDGLDGPPGDGTEWIDQDQLTRAQKALLALVRRRGRQLAEDHGVCVRPLAMRRLDLTSGRVDVVPVPCGSRWEDRCRPCADKNRRLRMAQCREGWHLDRGARADPGGADRAAEGADGRPRRPAHRLPRSPHRRRRPTNAR